MKLLPYIELARCTSCSVFPDDRDGEGRTLVVSWFGVFIEISIGRRA